MNRILEHKNIVLGFIYAVTALIVALTLGIKFTLVNICGGLFIVILIVLAVLKISNAPYGYEDETGFHEGKPK